MIYFVTYRYKDAVEPLVDKKDFDHTVKVTDEFAKSNGLGEKLQKSLVKRASQKENWVCFYFIL